VLASVLERLTALQEAQTRIARAQLKNTPKRKKTMAEYRREHPRKRLIRPAYQNNRLVDAALLTPENIELLDTIAAGRYGNGILTVARVGALRDSRIHMLYSNKDIEQRMTFYLTYPSLNVLIEKVHTEMTARGVQPVNDPLPLFAVEVEPEDNEDDLTMGL
jgi:hypothetical protein